MNNSMKVTATAFAVFLLAATTAQAADPAVKCESGKLKESSKYAACRLKADAKAVSKGEAADYTKCEDKFTAKWASVEGKTDPGICPSEGDVGTMNTRITTDAAEIATLLAGGVLPTCGDASIDAGEQCDGVALGGDDCATLGFTGGTLACDGSCFFDLSACTAGGGGLVPGVDPILPVTGQTTAYGTGSDGDVEAGAALSYTDNGDGTITDNNTGLMWEKKDDSGGIHDKDNNEYTWCGASCGTTNEMDGTIKTAFLDTLNDVGGGGASCFAGYCDWRIPNSKELYSILDLEVVSNPTVDPAFHQSATCTGCGDVTFATCSCTASSNYWSATTNATNPNNAWNVNFNNGNTNANNKTNNNFVRAVRAGS